MVSRDQDGEPTYAKDSRDFTMGSRRSIGANSMESSHLHTMGASLYNDIHHVLLRVWNFGWRTGKLDQHLTSSLSPFLDGKANTHDCYRWSQDLLQLSLYLYSPFIPFFPFSWFHFCTGTWKNHTMLEPRSRWMDLLVFFGWQRPQRCHVTQRFSSRATLIHKLK